MENILSLLYDYSIDGKFIDKEFIEKLVEYLVCKDNLGNYISNYEFSDHFSDDGVPARFILDSKKLITYLNIYDVANSKLSMQYNLYFYEKNLYKNIIIIQIILHEITHIKQFKMNDEKRKDLESVLINIGILLCKKSIFENPKENIDAYSKLGRYNPTERIAEIDSMRIVKDFVCSMEKQVPDLEDVLEAEFLKRNLWGYSSADLICPTEYFLTELNLTGTWNTFVANNAFEQYDLMERLRLGLPINLEEYRKIDEMIRKRI